MIPHLEFSDPYDAWRAAVKLIWEYDGNIDTEDKIIYPVPIVSTINTPTTTVRDNPLYSQSFINVYVEQILSGDKKGFEYTYGERLNAYPTDGAKINQIDCAIQRLKEDSESRRACCVTWNPSIDTQLDDCPCMQWMKFFIRGKYVCMQVLFRSHDIGKGYYPNLLMLSKLLMHVAKKLEKDVGYITLISSDAHLYKSDSDFVEGFINEHSLDKHLPNSWNDYRRVCGV